MVTLTERRALRHGTPGQLTHVYKARRMNVRCHIFVQHTKKSSRRDGQEDPRKYKRVGGPLHFASWHHAVCHVGRLRCGIQLASAGFLYTVGALICSKLSTSHRKTCLAMGHLQWLLCTSRFPSTKRFTPRPPNNPFSMSWLPLGIVRFFAFAQRVFLGTGSPSSPASNAKPAVASRCHFGRV